tara:strand:+ start:2389 stop:2793 length:405 start_codon:yes stop_codon:yes gene_type:complete
MKKSKFKPPYNLKDKPSFSKSFGKSGVYIIKEGNQVVYVGQSGYNLYKTMYRHFQKWDSSQKRATYKAKGKNRDKYKVRVIYTTPLQAERLEKYLCKKLDPRDMIYKYRQIELDFTDMQTGETYKDTKISDLPF